MNNAVASADACNMTGASSGFAQAPAFGMPTYVACDGIGPEGSSGNPSLAGFGVQDGLAAPIQIGRAEEV